jgi:preprotein translocase subunit SecD
MLHFSRWKTAAILAVTLFLCVAAIPNLLSQHAFGNLPAWVQRKITLSYELQGGSQILFEVDASDIRKRKLYGLRDEVRKLLREARVHLASTLAIRDNILEVRIQQEDLQVALARLSVLTDQIGSSAPDVVIGTEGNLVRFSITETAVKEQVRVSQAQAVEILERRNNNLGLGRFTVQPSGADRVLLEVPGPFTLNNMLQL